MQKVDNLIGGWDINLSKKYFTVKSQFYDDFFSLVADSDTLDVSIALSKVKNSWDDCQKISFKDRVNIIEKAAKNLNFSDDEIQSIVKIIGMPKTYISEQINQIPKIMVSFWKTITKRYGFNYEQIGLDFIENESFHKIEFRKSIEGFVYAITPGNDPRITALVSTVLVLLGIPGIIKPSKTDNIIPIKVVKAIIDAGYPANGLSVLFFDSENPKSKKLNFKICDEATVIWPFGDDNTINNLVRIENKTFLDVDKFIEDKKLLDIEKESQKFIKELEKLGDKLNNYILTQAIDHFGSKLVLKHKSGRCAGILDSDFDLNLAAKLIVESSMRYPIGCNSLKSVFVADAIFDKFVKILSTEFNSLEKYTSDPLDRKTKVGYIDKKTLLFLEKRIDELKRLNLVSVLYPWKKINSVQFTPLLVSTNDVNSELLINEIPAYILCLIKVNSFEEAVAHINRLSKSNPKLAVSYFTNNSNHMKLHINAHHLKINYLTTDIDGIIHEGNDYIMQLTRPYVVHIHKDHSKIHPYRVK